jgi:hypothetical protein
MMKAKVRQLSSILLITLPLSISSNVFAATAGVGQVESFIKNLITALASLSGLVATAFIVIGGFRYITP